MNYYNEFDPKAAAWLRALIAAGHIPNGIVDERSIAEVSPRDLEGYNQCHFFAGIGGWALALQIAGWPEDRPVWTGSCPCQPFSTAGKGHGAKDERHLWPALFNLIKVCRPQIVFGEQVASSEVVGSELEASFIIAVQEGAFAKANKLAKRLAQSSSFHFCHRWITGVQADLETADYSLRFEVLGAHSVGAPHIRQRLYWMAITEGEGREGMVTECETNERERSRSGRDSSDGGLEHTAGNGREQRRAGSSGRGAECGCVADAGGMAHHHHQRLEVGGVCEGTHQQPTIERGGFVGRMGDAASSEQRRTGESGPSMRRHGETGGPGAWSNYDILPCRDGKARRVESGSQPLAHGVPGRVGLLRGYGNAIVPQVAAQFIEASIEAVNQSHREQQTP